MTDIDPDFPRYKIPETTIDGPLHPKGAEVAVRLFARVGNVPQRAKRASGETIDLTVVDFGGPVEQKIDPGPDAPSLRVSRLFRTVVAVEVLVMVDGGRDVTLHNDGDARWLSLDTDEGKSGRVEFDALFREAVSEFIGGRHLLTVPGQIVVGPIEELRS